VEQLKRRRIPGRPAKLSTEELEGLKKILTAKPYWGCEIGIIADLKMLKLFLLKE
jgi:hypothetical protein